MKSYNKNNEMNIFNELKQSENFTILVQKNIKWTFAVHCLETK